MSPNPMRGPVADIRVIELELLLRRRSQPV